MQLRGPSMTSGICVVYGLHDSRLPSYLCLSNIHSCRCRYCKVDVAETLSIAVPLDPIDVPNITFRFCPGGKVTELLDAIFSTLAAFFGCNLLNLGSFFWMQSSQPSQPTRQPSSTIKQPSMRPSRQPSSRPSSETTCQPAISPTIMPSSQPSSKPSKHPSAQTSTAPLAQLSRRPSIQPFSMQPSKLPSSVFNVLQTATVIQIEEG